jgi:hypothetical protein
MGQLLYCMEPFLSMLGFTDSRALAQPLSEWKDVRLLEPHFSAEQWRNETMLDHYETKEHL